MEWFVPMSATKYKQTIKWGQMLRVWEEECYMTSGAHWSWCSGTFLEGLAVHMLIQQLEMTHCYRCIDSTLQDTACKQCFLIKGVALLPVKDSYQKDVMVHPAELCALDAYAVRHFHLASPPCIHTNTLPNLNMCCSWLNLQDDQTLTLLQRTPASESNCAAPYITSPLWRLSGTGNALLCIAVLLCRSIYPLQYPTYTRFILVKPNLRVNSCTHTHMWCRSYL